MARSSVLNRETEALRMLCGDSFEVLRHFDMKRCIEIGYRDLFHLTQVDLGFDPVAWHEYLKRTRASTYRLATQKPPPKFVLEALNNQEWHAHVAELREKYAAKSLSQHLKEESDARAEVERIRQSWNGEQRVCPRCSQSFYSCQDLGHCPQCGMRFLASAVYGIHPSRRGYEDR